MLLTSVRLPEITERRIQGFQEPAVFAHLSYSDDITSAKAAATLLSLIELN